MKTVSKGEMIGKVAVLSGINHATAGKVIDALLAEITAITAAGRPVVFMGFGRFEMRERAERNGRNPATGEAIRIPASRHLAFKASKS